MQINLNGENKIIDSTCRRNDIEISLTSLTAENRADALAAILAAEAGVALAVTQETLALAAATVRTVVRHVLGDHSDERDFVRIPIVVVKREEPVSRLHVLGHLFLDRRLRSKKSINSA